MSWRPAKSLEKLRAQINDAYPNRSKASDGMIGDTAHASTMSDHNPNSQGVVTAFDITHDPAHGLDIGELSDTLNASRDPRIKYLIANGLILVPDDYGWDNWQPYSGADPHTNHLHVSVYGDYDNTSDWNIKEEQVELFNEGDRKNINTALYGEDKGRYKVAVGKPFKEALYSILKSDQFKEDALLNKGDIENLKSRFGTGVSDKFVGKPSKSLLYGLTTPSPATAQQLKPGLYEVK